MPILFVERLGKGLILRPSQGVRQDWSHWNTLTLGSGKPAPEQDPPRAAAALSALSSLVSWHALQK